MKKKNTSPGPKAKAQGDRSVPTVRTRLLTNFEKAGDFEIRPSFKSDIERPVSSLRRRNAARLQRAKREREELENAEFAQFNQKLTDIFDEGVSKAKERALKLGGYATLEDGQVAVKRAE